MELQPARADSRFVRLSPENEWVIINPSRAGVSPLRDRGRPPEKRPSMPNVASCPFCPPSHLAAEFYEVLIFANESPILTHNDRNATGTATAAYGVNDVVIPSSKHNEPLDECSAPRIGIFIRALRERHKHHFNDGNIQSIFTFVSSGDRFGQSQPHPHGQLLGLPFVPKRISNIILGNERECLVCKEWQNCRDEGTLVLESQSFRAYIPSAPTVAYEIWISHKDHGGSLGDLTDQESDQVAALIQRCLRAIQADRFNPYTFNVHDVSPRLNNRHLRFEIVAYGRPDGGEKYLSAVELALGVFVNPFDPVSVASKLRDVVVRTEDW
jgi:UDPglucose--hexose-1-phosphate uridylyltransferase